MGEVKVNADNVNELWLNNEQFLAFDFTKLLSQLNLDMNGGSLLGNFMHVFNLSTNDVQIFGTNVPDTTISAKSSKIITLSDSITNVTIRCRNLGSTNLKLMWNFHYSNAYHYSYFDYDTMYLGNTDRYKDYECTMIGGVINIFNE